MKNCLTSRTAAFVVTLGLCYLHSTSIAIGQDVPVVVGRIVGHDFNPLNADGSFTSDRSLQKNGIADLANLDWQTRLLAIRDLLRSLPDERDAVVLSLENKNPHVRQIAAAVLGIAKQTDAIRPLLAVLQSDGSALVRSQAAFSLGQLEANEAIESLRFHFENDPSKDVRHQCELAIDQIEKRKGATIDQLQAFRQLDESTFERAKLGNHAPDFTLSDTDGNNWKLSDANRGKWVVLIWIFADWCPVCHSEFNDLMSMRKEFEDAKVSVVTMECHDSFRSRVMVGKEKDADYWFSKSSFQEKYRKSIWWPHLSDLAGAVGAQYGVDPMSFAVHAEYVNRPSTIIIDPQGVIRFAYYGTFWGDRPSMHETLGMIKAESFIYENPKRLK